MDWMTFTLELVRATAWPAAIVTVGLIAKRVLDATDVRKEDVRVDPDPRMSNPYYPPGYRVTPDYPPAGGGQWQEPEVPARPPRVARPDAPPAAR